MKKIIVLLVFAIFGFSFTGIENANAQTEYGFTIKWDPTNCNCGTIQDKRLDWTLVKLPPDYHLIWSELNKQVSGTSYYFADTSMWIDVDCRDCYYLEATIKYYDSSGLCCSATDGVTLSGTELNNKTAELLIEM